MTLLMTMNLVLPLCRTKLCRLGDVATVAVAVMIAVMMANPKGANKKSINGQL